MEPVLPLQVLGRDGQIRSAGCLYRQSRPAARMVGLSMGPLLCAQDGLGGRPVSNRKFRITRAAGDCQGASGLSAQSTSCISKKHSLQY